MTWLKKEFLVLLGHEVQIAWIGRTLGRGRGGRFGGNLYQIGAVNAEVDAVPPIAFASRHLVEVIAIVAYEVDAAFIVTVAIAFAEIEGESFAVIVAHPDEVIVRDVGTEVMA